MVAPMGNGRSPPLARSLFKPHGHVAGGRGRTSACAVSLRLARRDMMRCSLRWTLVSFVVYISFFLLPCTAAFLLKRNILIDTRGRTPRRLAQQPLWAPVTCDRRNHRPTTPRTLVAVHIEPPEPAHAGRGTGACLFHTQTTLAGRYDHRLSPPPPQLFFSPPSYRPAAFPSTPTAAVAPA